MDLYLLHKEGDETRPAILVLASSQYEARMYAQDGSRKELGIAAYQIDNLGAITDPVIRAPGIIMEGVLNPSFWMLLLSRRSA